MSAEGRVEHQKRTQTATTLWLFGFVFGVQLGSLEKRKRGEPGTCRAGSFALRCSLLTYHSYLLAFHTFFLSARSSFIEFCCIPIVYLSYVFGLCFTQLTACCPVLLSGSLLLVSCSFHIIRSLLFTRYSLLVVHG